MKTLFLPLLASLALAILLTSCGTHQEQPTVTKLEPKQYAGEWHEVGRLPNRFERDVIAAKATYTLRKAGGLTVKNEGLKSNGQKTEILGTITQPDPKQPGKLKVRFDPFPINLFAGDYWILALSQDHTRAMIGSPNQKYLWFLSKRERATKKNFLDFLKTAKKLGYDHSKVLWNPRRITTHTTQ